MRTTPISQQAFNDARVAAKAHPSDEIVMERGEPWARNLAIVCPICGVIFYGYQCQNRRQVDGCVDDEPAIIDPGIANGRRRTCGHPLCEHSEDNRQMGRSSAYQRAKKEYSSSKTEQPEQPKAKLTTLQRLK